MKKYHLEISVDARHDLTNLNQYLSKNFDSRSITTAHKKIIDHLRLLEDFPQAGQSCRNLLPILDGYFYLQISKSIFFPGFKIEVQHPVRYTKRSWRPIL
ncbi:type II toxin-antitoxin system RelE/ParE family toxin [Lactiplantibacillus songbeiensis]|uniref:Type II toxin-antitoxin system RelE/ParE family toxin n=1 Tax=Lactiplantibacillus songbeiensis TaxID=2559920 RepID=A0ABW4C3W7_9LACO